jgi:NAD(P)-dependent dehydrogenase (short-subunit alcohol dehydrogenase family)
MRIGGHGVELDGCSAVVSGGASGLGAGSVRHLVAAGVHCTVLDLDEKAGTAIAEELGRSVTFVKGDVTVPDSVRQAVSDATAHGTLRIAVSCAGIARARRVINREGVPHDLEAFDLVMRVNVYGTFNMMTIGAAEIAKTPPLKDNVRGVLINTASVAAFEGQTGQLAYSASKGAIVGMTLPAARDLSVVGIRVMTIAPGVFETPLLAGLLGEARAELGASVLFPKRLGTPDDFGALVVLIAKHDYLNGEIIRLDGGIRLPPK